MSLEKFIQRQKEITRNVVISETRYHSRYYRFAHDLDEDDDAAETNAQTPAEQPFTAQQGGEQADAQNFSDPNAQGGGEEEDIFAPEEGGANGGVNGGADANADAGQDDPNAAPGVNLDDSQPAPDAPADGSQDQEIDVTELVNGNQEVSNKVDNVIMKLDQSTQNINNLVGSLSGLEGKLTSMQSALNNLSLQVNLMRPPTEDERREAMKQVAYPFNQSVTDYEGGAGPKTQTDMENASNKLSMQNILATYNKSDVKNSF